MIFDLKSQAFFVDLFYFLQSCNFFFLFNYKHVLFIILTLSSLIVTDITLYSNLKELYSSLDINLNNYYLSIFLSVLLGSGSSVIYSRIHHESPILARVNLDCPQGLLKYW